MGGDIKYRDVNEDGVISALDQVPIGYPTVPEINYGFGTTIGYKDLIFILLPGIWPSIVLAEHRKYPAVCGWRCK